VQHAALVRGGHAGTELARDLDRFVLRNAADPAEQRREVLAVDVLHREKPPAVGVAEIVEAADVLVRHLARDAQLVVELREPRRIGGGALGQELQRDRLIEREVVGAVDLAHAAAPQQADDAEAAGEHHARGKSAALADRSCCAGSACARGRRGRRRRHL